MDNVIILLFTLLQPSKICLFEFSLECIVGHKNQFGVYCCSHELNLLALTDNLIINFEVKFLVSVRPLRIFSGIFGGLLSSYLPN